MNHSRVNPFQMMVNALRAKPPVISVDENGMMMNSGSMRMVVGEGHHLPCLVGLREVGLGVEQGVAVGVLGEEGQHTAGALGP